MVNIQALVAAATLLQFSYASPLTHDGYDIIYSRNVGDNVELYARDEDLWDIPLLRRYHLQGYYRTGDLSPEKQKEHALALQKLMNEDFERHRQDKLTGPNKVSGDARRHWKDAKPPMLDTIHKPGTDGRIHYGTSAGNHLNPPAHEPKTNEMMEKCGGPGNHNSGGKCAEHYAIDSFHKKNPDNSIKGANSFSVGERASDRKSGNPGPKPQEACKGIRGKAGCEDHLKAAGINDLVHDKGTYPGDDKKKNKNKPGGKNRKEPDMHFGSTHGGQTKRPASAEPEASPKYKVPKNDEHTFPALPVKSHPESKPAAPKESSPKPSFAGVVKDATKDAEKARSHSPAISSGSSKSEKTVLKTGESLLKKLFRRELVRVELERRLNEVEW